MNFSYLRTPVASEDRAELNTNRFFIEKHTQEIYFSR